MRTPSILADYLTFQDLAAELVVNVKTLRHWIKRGEAPAITKLGPRFIRFHRADVAQWLVDRKAESRRPVRTSL